MSDAPRVELVVEVAAEQFQQIVELARRHELTVPDVLQTWVADGLARAASDGCV